MFFLLIVILLLSIFLLLQKNRTSNQHLIILVLSYFIALSSMLLYISKDTFYYNLIREYFYLPDFLWRWLFFIQIDKADLIRLMNFSSLSILVISTYFSLHFYNASDRHTKTLRTILWVYALLQLLLYDPALHILSYRTLYPDYLSVKQYHELENLIYSFTRASNILVIFSGFLFLVLAGKASPKLKLFRFHYFFLALSYAVLSFVYLYFISATPAFYLKISKIAGTYSFRSIHLGSNILIYQIFPYFLIPVFGIITYCAYRLARLKQQASMEELFISKEISSSETTSKIFCHYIKNEILAIQSEVEMLENPQEIQTIQSSLLKRCDTLYNRIDEIHRSTKTSELNLKSYSMQKLIEDIKDAYSGSLSSSRIITDLPPKPILALIDPVYMEQALHNIIKNSLDAMEGLPTEDRLLTIALSTGNHWIQIRITDTGKGISKENLDKIFLPFYSSQPYSRHWGIGLTMTYKIIRAHEGKILVTSTPFKGTCMEILLPYVNC